MDHKDALNYILANACPSTPVVAGISAKKKGVLKMARRQKFVGLTLGTDDQGLPYLGGVFQTEDEYGQIDTCSGQKSITLYTSGYQEGNHPPLPLHVRLAIHVFASVYSVLKIAAQNEMTRWEKEDRNREANQDPL